VDGAKLDNSGQVTIGFKICDKIAKYPVTGKYIYTNAKGEKDDEHIDNLQSGAWCFPIISIIVKDNKETYDKYLHPIFAYCEELHAFGVPNKGWKLCLVSEPQDMTSRLICLHRGWAAKSPSVKHFCHLCHIIRSADISLPTQVPCPECVLSGSTMPCFHHPVTDAHTMQG
jgi:hypothetical protein